MENQAPEQNGGSDTIRFRDQLALYQRLQSQIQGSQIHLEDVCRCHRCPCCGKIVSQTMVYPTTSPFWYGMGNYC